MDQKSVTISKTTDLNPTHTAKSAAENMYSSHQATQFSSNIAVSTSQETSITESVVQSQKSQMIQERSSCTLQSFSQQGTSESQSYSMFQTHKASDQKENFHTNKKVIDQSITTQDKQTFNQQNEQAIKEMKMQETQIKASPVGFQNKLSPKTSASIAPCMKSSNPPQIKANMMPSSSPPCKTNANSKLSTFKSITSKPTSTVSKNPTPNRLSMIDALTIAPDRPYSPLSFNIPLCGLSMMGQNQENTDIPRTIVNQTDNSIISRPLQSSEHSQMQNTGMLQTSSDVSAFKPVGKQVYPPPRPQEFSSIAHKDPSVDVVGEKTSSSHSFSPVKTPQPMKVELHKPETIPPYQQNLEFSPIQRGQTPDLYRTSPLTQTGTSVFEKTLKQKETAIEQKNECTITPIPMKSLSVQQTQNKIRTNDVSTSFQPVTDETMIRNSPVLSRPTTPSVINKPAPIIPHYQMNLVTVEHAAPEGHTYIPHGDEFNQSSSPKQRARSPAPGSLSNSLRAHAPRIKETSTKIGATQSQTSRTEQEMVQAGFQGSNITKWLQDQPSMEKEEMQSNIEYHTESYCKGDMKIREDSLQNQSYGQRQMESQNVSEYGNTSVQTTRKTFEEYERAQSAKVIEIHQGGSLPSGLHQHTKPNIQPSNVNLKQVYPPPIAESTLLPQNLSFNTTNENVATAGRQTEIYQPIPIVSGANKGPVCDPTPSTDSSVGVAARGKAFGVSSAPKRGRGVLNKAAQPGSRVPLCASCNGNIRGPFITALGRIWCPEHFICVNATCRRQLQDIGFVEENNQLYCEYCFEQYIAPACDKCHAKIKGDCLNAIGKHFHPECFSCVYCGKLFGNNPFFLEDGLPYCEADWNELFTTKCFACGFPVEAGDRWVEALSNNYHSQCFNCTVCKKNLEGQSFFAKGGRPFCKMHAR